jgi:MoaA/NifB/PqqE/SkfB family radical SAM enzyme
MSRRVLDKNFCVLPWTGFELEPNGNVKNCIISTEVIGNIKQQSIEEIIQANRKIRQDMLDGKYPSNCAGCYKQEKHRKKDFSSISSRLYYAKEITPKVPSELFEKAENFKLKHVDLRWTNKCNQACVYCGPEYSSKWEQELGKKMQFDKTANERLKDYIYEHVQDLENVYLAGGEPMLMKQNKDFLEHLYKHNPNATLRVNSNLSKTNTGIFDLICKFQNVHWTVSVESIEEEYNYIRHHGNWHDFLENLQTLKNTNHKITFNMLYFILNHRSIFDCVNFFQKQGFHNNSFVIGPLHTPLHLNVLNLPKKIINECVELFQKQIDSKPGFLLQNSYENILSYLTETEFYANIELTKQELLKMDQRRNIDSRKVFQKLYKEAF